MTKTRLEAFSDGVIAILITIMVLELKVPHGADFAAIQPLRPVFLSYVLSFVFLGIYWNNHHHLLHMADRINGKIMWGNLHLLFWLSLIPFTTTWVGENHLAALPTAVYGVVLFLSAVAFIILQRLIIAEEGHGSKLAAAVKKDFKIRLSLVMYLAAIALSFVNQMIANTIYVAVALMWFLPDRRIEKSLSH